MPTTPQKRTFARPAQDPKKGMNLGELLDFVSAARSDGLCEQSRIHISLGWSGQIREITAIDAAYEQSEGGEPR